MTAPLQRLQGDLITGEWNEVTSRPRLTVRGGAQGSRPDYPVAWDNDREAVLRRLAHLEKWTVQETAFYLRVSTDHVYNLIADGTVAARNVARHPASIPLYRVDSASVRAFEADRAEGAK